MSAATRLRVIHGHLNTSRKIGSAAAAAKKVI
jgi:hypothetical protein